MKAHPFIGAEKAAGHGVARACRLLKVSRAAYYQRRTGVPSPRRAADAALTARITSIHGESKGTYGSPRVHQALRRQDVELREAAGRPADARRRAGGPPQEAVADHHHRRPGRGTGPGPDPA